MELNESIINKRLSQIFLREASGKSSITPEFLAPLYLKLDEILFKKATDRLQKLNSKLKSKKLDKHKREKLSQKQQKLISRLAQAAKSYEPALNFLVEEQYRDKIWKTTYEFVRSYRDWYGRGRKERLSGEKIKDLLDKRGPVLLVFAKEIVKISIRGDAFKDKDDLELKDKKGIEKHLNLNYKKIGPLFKETTAWWDEWRDWLEKNKNLLPDRWGPGPPLPTKDEEFKMMDVALRQAKRNIPEVLSGSDEVKRGAYDPYYRDPQHTNLESLEQLFETFKRRERQIDYILSENGSTQETTPDLRKKLEEERSWISLLVVQLEKEIDNFKHSLELKQKEGVLKKGKNLTTYLFGPKRRIREGMLWRKLGNLVETKDFRQIFLLLPQKTTDPTEIEKREDPNGITPLDSIIEEERPREKYSNLSEREAKILALRREKPTPSQEEIAKELGISRITVIRDMHRIKQKYPELSPHLPKYSSRQKPPF